MDVTNPHKIKSSLDKFNPSLYFMLNPSQTRFVPFNDNIISLSHENEDWIKPSSNIQNDTR